MAWRYDPAGLQVIDIGGDLFDDQLVAAVERAAQLGRPRSLLAGYTWPSSDWSVQRTKAIRHGPESASKQQYVAFLKERYSYSIERVNELYGLESTSFTDLLTDKFTNFDSSRPAVLADDRLFLIEAAGRLAESLTEALKQAHPAALLFSEPFFVGGDEAAAAMASHVDVLVSQRPLPAAKAQVLLMNPPQPLPANVVGLAGEIGYLQRLLPIPPK